MTAREINKAAALRMVEGVFGEGKYKITALCTNKDGTFDLDLEELGWDAVTFADMAKVSDLFNTKSINVSSYYDRGCPTCGGSTEYTLEVQGATVQ